MKYRVTLERTCAIAPQVGSDLYGAGTVTAVEPITDTREYPTPEVGDIVAGPFITPRQRDRSAGTLTDRHGNPYGIGIGKVTGVDGKFLTVNVLVLVGDRMSGAYYPDTLTVIRGAA